VKAVPRLDRRGFLSRTTVVGSAFLLASCERLSQSSWWRDVLEVAESWTRRSQRALLSRDRLAPEYAEADLSPAFKPNGSTDPDDPAYRKAATTGFADWRLEIGGLVERPASLSLAELRALPSRTQITRHDCVEGWSCIGKWKGVPLATVLRLVGLKPEARYVVFHCADSLEPALDGSGQYYESIDLFDAFHPQTILAYDMNDRPLPIPNGAPLRVRVERQLGYKMAKYVMRIEAVESFAAMKGGRGGYWEDRGYEWYAGI
jgi:DMSO/TMAO reductase YedYZ molybdopterin-dependent catalytic subunit